MSKYCAALLVALSIANLMEPAYAQFMSGQQLVERIRDYEKFMRGDKTFDSMNYGFYSGYVIGVSDVYLDGTICPPDGTKIGTMLAVVTKYFNEHPEMWARAADTLVWRALNSAFPCKK